jgi:transcriptional regulator with XRE-family HTH domain
MEEKETVPDDVGERLKAIRIEQKMSQTQFAQKLGLTSPSLVSDVERGTRDPSKRMLLAIHNEFKQDLNWLFNGPNDELYSQQRDNNEKIKQLEEMKEHISQQEQKTQQLTGGIDELNRQIQGYAQTVKEKNQQIDELKEERTTLLKENGRLKDELLSLMRK